MGISIQFGLGTSIAQLLHAVGDVRDAEGLSVTGVQSIHNEIEVVIVRPDAAAARTAIHSPYLVVGGNRRFAPL